MRRSRILPVLLVVLGATLIVTSIGWFRAADKGELLRFTSCAIDDGTAVVTYDYGARSKVTATADATGDELVVGVWAHQEGGDVEDVGLSGELRFSVFDSTELRYPDGEPVDCESS
jgi:hypothetical protein